ncbi:MAG: hypothetical protein Q8R47_06020 [Nanoarchaeota archaeon]|nr:hypothetical protein [Nanoarchaeota archaeon]
MTLTYHLIIWREKMKDKKIASLGLAMLVGACGTALNGVIPAHSLGVGSCGNNNDTGTLQWTETVSRDKSKYSLELCFESKGFCNSMADAYVVFDGFSKHRQRNGYQLADKKDTKDTVTGPNNEWVICREYDFVRQ